MEKLNDLDLGILKYYKEGKELCGFEGVHTSLCDKGYLDGDLYLERKAYKFIKDYPDWDKVEIYSNAMYIRIKVNL